MTSDRWVRMTKALPGLLDLVAEAREAGRRGARWWDTWRAVYERLSHLVGFAADGGLFMDSRAFTLAHDKMLWAWAHPDGFRQVAPWEDEGEAVPLPPAFGTVQPERQHPEHQGT